MVERKIGSRAGPGGRYRLSELTISLAPPDPPSPGWASFAVPLLERARAAGVTTFDLTSAPRPPLAEEILLRAFPRPDPELVAIVRAPGGAPSRSPTRAPAGADRSPPARPLEETLGRLAGRFGLIVEWRPTAGGTGRLPDSLAARKADGTVLDVATPIGPDEEVGSLAPSTVRTGPLSLLEPQTAIAIHAGTPPDGFALIARDVFAGGALDGSLLEGPAVPRGPAAPPLDLGDLRRRLAPVLSLGFLTEGHRRTLAQAAVRFALHWPWVLTAVVPLPTPERYSALFEGEFGPELSDDELRRLGAGPAGETRPPR